MLATIIIFYLSIILAFGMIYFQIREIRHLKVNIDKREKSRIPHFPFRNLEKNMLYFTKHVLQNIVFRLAKHWYIIVNKVRKWINQKWPKIDSYFTEKPQKSTPYRHSFLKKAILESKVKLKKIKAEVDKEIE